MAFFILNILEAKITGTVCRIESKDVYVISEDNRTIRCSMKGKFKKVYQLKKDKLYHTDIVVVGDSVEYDMNDDGTGVIFEINQRRNYLSRKAPRIKGAGYRGERLEQIIAANLDLFFIITSINEPPFNNKALDRFLVTGESAHLDIVIVINKTDLDQEGAAEIWTSFYQNIGYKTLATSAADGTGQEELKELMKDKTSLLWGHSGVGKSSLLNALFPSLDLAIGKVSSYTDRGIHTTVTAVMLEPEPGIKIIDTPGIREIEPYGLRKEDLGHYFIEFEDFINKCRFNTCTHHHEPDCAVIEAVENENISPDRYDSYLRMLETIEEDIVF